MKANDNKNNPNIVFILADDMGYGDVGCYNASSKIPTPNMDRLAGEGMRFNDAHSSSAVCTPSRYSILTGRYCWRSELKRGVLYGYEPPIIEPERMTIAKMLKNAGYNTACIGKWHLGLEYKAKEGAKVDFKKPLPWKEATKDFEEQIDFNAQITGGPIALGFDYFYGTSGCSTCQPPYGFIENDRFENIPTQYHDNPYITSRKGMMAEGWKHKNVDVIFSKKSVEYIKEQEKSDKPFFLYIGASSPHEPCVDAVVPEFARGKSQAGPRGDMVWLFDWMVGNIMNTLEETGQADNTLIIVTSDNGALPGDRIPIQKDAIQKDVWEYRTYGHKSCGEFKGYKSHFWEGGHREPLIAKWSEKIKANQVSNDLLCLTDMFKTFADIVQQDIPENTAEDSINMLSVFLNSKTNEPLRQDMIHHSGRGVFSIRKNNWKLTVNSESSGGWPPLIGEEDVEQPHFHLYDIGDDPYEKNNLYDKYPEIAAELQALLNKYVQSDRSI